MILKKIFKKRINNNFYNINSQNKINRLLMIFRKIKIFLIVNKMMKKNMVKNNKILMNF
jgi:hypothetical protein